MDVSAGYGVAALLGVVMPFVISFLKDVTWSTQAKHAVSLAVSAVAAVGITAIDNGVDLANWQNFVANLGIIFTVSNVVYRQYFENTALNLKVENVGVGARKVG